MKDQELAQRLMATFLEELHMHVSSIGRELLALEKDPTDDERAESWTTICRAAHTLKGASAVVDIAAIQSACHSLEDIFGVYRDSGRPLSEDMTSTLLKAVDAIEETGMRLRAEQDLDDSPLTKMLPELKRLAELELAGDAAKARPSSPGRSGVRKPEPAVSTPSPEPAPTVAVDPETDFEFESDSAEKKPEKAVAAETGSKTRLATLADKAASIRVPAQKLDALLSHSGELLVARGRFAFRAHDAAALCEMATDLRGLWRESEKSVRHLSDALANRDGGKLPEKAASLVEQAGRKLASLTTRLDALTNAMEADNRLLHQTCKQLDDDVFHARMLPFSDACGGLERAVRDIATATNKEVTLVLEGTDVEVDRSVLEGLKDPLLHLVRNAVDHGVDLPARRVAAGKPARATVRVSAEFRGGQVEVRVEDDGRGLDLHRIREIARKREMEIPDDPSEQVRLIFVPGFSTAKLITDISGRGVGLDVVRSQVESLHGSVDVSFEPGKRTSFILTVPLTLTTVRSMLVSVAGQIYAIPTSAVQWLVRFGADDVKLSAGRRHCYWGTLPRRLYRLLRQWVCPRRACWPANRPRDSRLC